MLRIWQMKRSKSILGREWYKKEHLGLVSSLGSLEHRAYTQLGEEAQVAGWSSSEGFGVLGSESRHCPISNMNDQTFFRRLMWSDLFPKEKLSTIWREREAGRAIRELLSWVRWYTFSEAVEVGIKGRNKWEGDKSIVIKDHTECKR